MMTLVEFNEMDLIEKHKFLFGERTSEIRFNSLRDDDDYKYSLWDCGDFYVEMVASKAVKRAVSWCRSNGL